MPLTRAIAEVHLIRSVGTDVDGFVYRRLTIRRRRAACGAEVVVLWGVEHIGVEDVGAWRLEGEDQRGRSGENNLAMRA